MRIGILGGSFSPVHAGHLKIARHAMDELNLEKVYFVPSCQTPLKNSQNLLPAAVRIRLLREAIAHQPGFALSLCEIRRKGLSFTVDTLQYFRKKFGKKAVLFFLCGTDAVQNFSRWRKPEELLKLARFVVMTRTGSSARRLPEGMLYLPMETVNVSSTEIRSRLKKNQTLSGLLPKGVERRLLSLTIKK